MQNGSQSVTTYNSYYNYKNKMLTIHLSDKLK